MLRIQNDKRNTGSYSINLSISNKSVNVKNLNDFSQTKSLNENDSSLPTLLIVDDDENILKVAQRMLAGAFSIKTAKNAVEGARLLKENYFNAVLTDFNMPDRNGLWLLDIARKSNPQIRRVLFSGDGPADISEHMQSGLIHKFVAKPSGKKELTAALKYYDGCHTV